jgi:hypothetical protein
MPYLTYLRRVAAFVAVLVIALAPLAKPENIPWD